MKIHVCEISLKQIFVQEFVYLQIIFNYFLHQDHQKVWGLATVTDSKYATDIAPPSSFEFAYTYHFKVWVKFCNCRHTLAAALINKVLLMDYVVESIWLSASFFAKILRYADDVIITTRK